MAPERPCKGGSVACQGLGWLEQPPISQDPRGEAEELRQGQEAGRVLEEECGTLSVDELWTRPTREHRRVVMG